MGHLYASLVGFKHYLSGGDYGTDRDAEIVAVLGSVSRAIDGFCCRSRFGSGFGPRNGTNTYRTRSRALLLEDDLASLDELTVNGTVIDPEDLVVEKRRIAFRNGRILSGDVTAAGTWSYPFATLPATSLAEAIDDTVQMFSVAAASSLSRGQTVLVDDEQMEIVAIGGEDQLTVLRGTNGTEAASHLDEATVTVYVYAAEAVEATMRAGQRRWKGRDAGLTGVFGGGDVPQTSNQDSELAIFWSSLGHLRIPLVR